LFNGGFVPGNSVTTIVSANVKLLGLYLRRSVLINVISGKVLNSGNFGNRSRSLNLFKMCHLLGLFTGGVILIFSLVFVGYPKMPQQRGKQHHMDRISEALKEEIGAVIEGELGDPRIALCNVTEVLLAPDGKSARVFVHVEGSEQESKQTLKAVEAAKGYIRHELLERLGVRHVPDLNFVLDRSEELGARIDELLSRTKKRKT
jgi:ribosome-binding factor A